MPTTTLISATPDQKPVIANLIQLYLHDLTEVMPFAVGEDGRYAYDFLDRFWRFPYLIKSGNEISGFALVIDECPLTGRAPCWFMAEFFVLRPYRREGTGKAAANLALASHPGPWHVATPNVNAPAKQFWGRALAIHSPNIRDIHFDGDDWQLHALEISR